MARTAHQGISAESQKGLIELDRELDSAPPPAPTTSLMLEHMNETYEVSQAMLKQREAEAATARKAIIDKYKPTPAHEKLLTETADAITTIFKGNAAALKEALGNKNFIPELIDVIRSSGVSQDTTKPKGK